MFKVVVGHSNDPDSEEAIAEVLEQCLTQLNGITPQAAILYAAIDFEREVILERIYRQFPELELIGGTTDGEISSRLGFQEDSLTIMLFCSDEIAIRAGIGKEVSRQPATAVKEAIDLAKANMTQEVSLCITLPDGLTSNGVSLIHALKHELGSNIPIVGGLTADCWRFEQTYQFYQREILTDTIPVLLFSGNLLVACGVNSGWNPIGKKSLVTKVKDNILYEVDGKPALDFYQYYLGDLFPSLEYPLAVFERDSHKFYLRAPSGYDSEKGTITFLADIPEGAIVQITETTSKAILSSSEISMKNALDRYPGKEPSAALFFSCAARRQLLGTKAQEEYQMVQKHLQLNLPCCGFYSNGEIAPLEEYGATLFHNETFITVLLGTK
jgi:hypothetical protein